MKVECPRCHTHVEKLPGANPVCPTCGFGSAGGAAPSPPVAPAAVASDPATPYATSAPSAAPSYGGATGWAPPQAGDTWQPGASKPQLNQSMAITALVLGILGCCIFGPLTGIPAIIVGAIAMKKVKQQPEVYSGNGMALAGLILGIFATLVGIITIILFAVGLGSLPPECLADPESVACDEALQEPMRIAPGPAGTAALAAPLWILAPGRPWLAG